MNNLHDYQEEAVDYVMDREGCNLFMAPGLGKTRIALETIGDYRTLVIAPLLVARNSWPAENAKWGYDYEMRLLHGKELRLEGQEQISIINYEGLPKLAELLGSRSKRRAFPFEAVIYDEIQCLKDPGTVRFRKWRHQMDRFTYRLGLTGTPVGNSLLNLWGEQFCVDFGSTLGRTYTAYKQQYFYQLYHGGYRSVAGAEEEIFARIKPTAKAFDLDRLNMPPIIHNVKTVDLPEEARAWYTEMANESTIENLELIAPNAAVRTGKKRQIASGAVYDAEGHVHRLHSAKKELLQGIIDELQGSPALIVYDYGHSIEPISSCFKSDDIGFINGDTKQFKADENIAAWNNGDLKGLAIHPAKAARGLNLQDSGHTVIFYDVPWSYELLMQAIHRVWRQGQKNRVVVHYLAVEGTVEEDVIDKADDNDELHDKAMKALA